MLRALVTLFLLSLSVVAYAQKEECATDVEGLKQLIGNADLPLVWKENSTQKPLTLTLKDGKDSIIVDLDADYGDWATVQGKICKRDDFYVAYVNYTIWGPASPYLVRKRGIRELYLSLPYQSVLKVSVSFLTFDFFPLP